MLPLLRVADTYQYITDFEVFHWLHRRFGHLQSETAQQAEEVVEFINILKHWNSKNKLKLLYICKGGKFLKKLWCCIGGSITR